METQTATHHEETRKQDANSPNTAKSPAAKPTFRHTNKRKLATPFIRAKRSNPQFMKAPQPTTLSTYVIKAYFTVSCSNRGILPMVHNMYEVLKGRDSKLANAMSETMLLYVTNICFMARCAKVSSDIGSSFVNSCDELMTAAKGLFLPDFLASYIESIGTIDLHGATIVPYFSNLRDMRESSIFLSPSTILTNANRDLPNNPWLIDSNWLLEYQASIARALKGNLSFRRISWSDNSGKTPFLCSYDWNDDDMIGFCPMAALESDVKLGAMCKYRFENGRNEWIGADNAILYPLTSTKGFNPDFEMYTLILQNLQKRSD